MFGNGRGTYVYKCKIRWTTTPTFTIAFYPVLAGIYLLIALLIDSEARWHRSIALAILAKAFLFVFAAVVAYLVVFPGAFTPQGLLGAKPHSSLWIWMFWHFGFGSSLWLMLCSILKSEGQASGLSDCVV